MNATTMVSNHSVNWAAQPFPKEKGKHLSEILILVTPSICWPRKMLSFLSTSSNIFKWISRFQGFHHNFTFDPRRTRGPCLSATWKGILLLIQEYRWANHAASQPPSPPAPQNPGPSSGREEILFHFFPFTSVGSQSASRFLKSGPLSTFIHLETEEIPLACSMLLECCAKRLATHLKAQIGATTLQKHYQQLWQLAVKSAHAHW